MRYVQINLEIVGPQQVIRLIETGDEITEPGYIDVTDLPEVSTSAWYDVESGGFVEAPAPPAPEALTAEQITRRRRAAYVAESDPLKTEAEYDAMINDSEPDYSAWLTAVAEIKGRFPLPVEN
jgi:hypothetical protein